MDYANFIANDSTCQILRTQFEQTETGEDWQTNIHLALEQSYPRLEAEVPGPARVPAKQLTDWFDHIKVLIHSVGIKGRCLAIYRRLPRLTAGYTVLR